ncbi:hypothetical protein [Methylobacterium sp. PvR107]|uniref:hypothetical protein n=1 Tax=Methylobacterium sp. PvR107 TaxID=2806597 RepID=UPI001AE7CB96|nr:hypothetical protein [Methylobacterium sp. PvR107]MBP1181012.1 hypothetical protein [Methylobacterium sp. PvR107]
MRHVIGPSSAASAGTLCVLALVGLVAPGGAAPVADRGARASAASLRDGAACAGAAWPYPPGACAGLGAAGERAPRRVRLIAVEPAPGLR